MTAQVGAYRDKSFLRRDKSGEVGVKSGLSLDESVLRRD